MAACRRFWHKVKDFADESKVQDLAQEHPDWFAAINGIPIKGMGLAGAPVVDRELTDRVGELERQLAECRQFWTMMKPYQDDQHVAQMARQFPGWLGERESERERERG